jgi:hypothetical protein
MARSRRNQKNNGSYNKAAYRSKRGNNNRSGNNNQPEADSANTNGNPTVSRTSGNTAVQNIIANSANIATRNIAGYAL